MNCENCPIQPLVYVGDQLACKRCKRTLQSIIGAAKAKEIEDSFKKVIASS